MISESIINAVEKALEQHHFLEWYHYLLILVIAAVGAYIGSYLREKGSNLAKQEDLSKITTKIEEVKLIFAKKLESKREKHSLRLAALDRRLEAHQQAYTLWLKLMRNVHDETQIRDVVRESQKWWDEHCLFLSPISRKKFNKAIHCAFDHKFYLQDRGDPDTTKENWIDIESAGEAILKDVELPSLGKDEIYDFDKKDKG